MKIFLISNLYPSKEFPNFGTFVAGFADAMQERGGEIVYKAVIDRKYTNKLRLLFAYIRLYISILRGLFTKYDMIYVHYIAHTALPVYILSFFNRKPIILNAHGDDILPRTKLVEYMQYIIKCLLPKVSLVVVPSLFFKDVFLSRFSFDEKKVYVYPSGGIDRTVFKKSTIGKKDLGFNNDDIVVGFVSRIIEGKGWRLFIDAIMNIIVRKENVKGLIIGNGEEVEELKLYLQSNNLQGNIHFIENVNHMKLNDYYSIMDVFVFPTLLYESLGLVGLEAMSCGTPVIASDIGGIKTYMKDGYNGYLFLPGDKKNLVSKIESFLNLSAIEQEEMEKNCILTAERYESNNVTKELYLKLLSL